MKKGEREGGWHGGRGGGKGKEEVHMYVCNGEEVVENAVHYMS